jgi:hypothetical protein
VASQVIGWITTRFTYLLTYLLTLSLSLSLSHSLTNSLTHAHTHTRAHTRARARAHTHTRTRTRAHTRTHTRTHAHTHTHTHTGDRNTRNQDTIYEINISAKNRKHNMGKRNLSNFWGETLILLERLYRSSWSLVSIWCRMKSSRRRTS